MPDSRGALPKITAAMLRDHSLFASLSEGTLNLLASELTPEVAQPGQSLMVEGELASHMFIILTGEIEILSIGDHGSVRVALLGPGDWVGEMAVLEVQPRSATAMALAPSVLLRLTADDVRRLFAERDKGDYAQLILNVARELSRRLRVADRLIANGGATMAQRYVRESMRPPG